MELAVSVGCPSGIGPEVAVVAASHFSPALGKLALVGDPGALEEAAMLREVKLSSLSHVRVVPASRLAPAERAPGRPGVAAGRAQLAAIDRALDMVMLGECDALVTGPVSKKAIADTGVAFFGHTEHLQQRSGAGPVVMCFVGPKLRTALVTTHLPLAQVPAAVTRERVSTTVALAARALWRDFEVPAPRVVVAGLNPHAGEGGLLGDEELREVLPGVEDARGLLAGVAQVEGPMPAEAAFRKARDGHFDLVVAMFHDQATIASKLLDFGDAVNVTLGLPLIRTSVDHGTGYDVAGMGVASSSGMEAAMALAARMVSARSGSRP